MKRAPEVSGQAMGILHIQGGHYLRVTSNTNKEQISIIR